MPAAAVKLKLPLGLYQNGTEYDGAGRYIDGDLIRWHNGVIKPINGWRKRYSLADDADMPPLWGDGFASEAVRSGTITGSAVGGSSVWLGSNKAIYHLSNTSAIVDVTPTLFVPQEKNAQSNVGYGAFRYSFGQFGTQRPAPQEVVENCFTWGFTEWGFWPMAVARQVGGSPIYVKRDTDATFVPIDNSPVGVNDIVVTDERFLIAIGASDNDKLVQWCDQENFENWDFASATSQAGFISLASTGKLIRGIKVGAQILVLGTTDAFIGQYVGPPYVYGFPRIGDKCGLIGPEAVTVAGGVAMWLSGSGFFIYDGAVRELPCEVLDKYMSTHNVQQRSKTVAFTVSDYSEVWWLYQSNTSLTGDVDSYVVYNYALKCWYTGKLDRTFGLDSDPLAYSLMVSPDGQVYDHEVPAAGREGRIPFIQTGPLELQNGDRLLGLSYVLPDAKTTPDVKMELSVRDYPQPEGQENPVRYARDFDLRNPTSTMGIMGRDIRMKLYGAGVNPMWEIGAFRVIPMAAPGPMR